MSKESITILLKLEGDEFQKFDTISKHKGIRTGKDLVRNLIFEEYNRIAGVAT